MEKDINDFKKILFKIKNDIIKNINLIKNDNIYLKNTLNKIINNKLCDIDIRTILIEKLSKNNNIILKKIEESGENNFVNENYKSPVNTNFKNINQNHIRNTYNLDNRKPKIYNN